MMRNGLILLIAAVVCALSIHAPSVMGQAPKSTVLQFDIDFSNDSSLVGTCGDKVRIFDAASGKPIRELESATTRSIAFSPAKTLVAAGGEDDGVIRLFDIDKPDAVRNLTEQNGRINALTFSKDGRLLASGSEEGQFRLWDIETGKPAQSLDVKKSTVSGIAFSGDGKLVAFCRNRNAEPSTVEVYQINPWGAVASFKLSAGELKGSPFGLVAQFVPGSRRLLVLGGICVPGTPAEVFPYKSGCKPMSLLWGADLADKAAAKLLQEPRVGENDCLSLSPDGKRYATAGIQQGGGRRPVEMREVEQGKLVWKADTDSYSRGIKVSPNGKWVTCIRGSRIWLMDAENGTLARTIEVGR